MARASIAKRRRTTPRTVSQEPLAVEDMRTEDIFRRFQDEIIRNPIRWVLIGLSVGYLYGRFRR
jgi:hypothetical protein